MNNKAAIKVLCVDDHKFMGDGINSRLALEPDIEFVGWLASAQSLGQEIDRTQADIVLLDIEMPGPDPFEVLTDIVRTRPRVRVIMLSAYIRDRFIDAAVEAGAWGYLSKSDSPNAVIEAIRTVRNGAFAFGPKVLERCQPSDRGKPGRAGRPSSRLESLTPRESQILRLIGNGLSRIEIAGMINRSPKTVDNHRASIMEKLGISDRVALARFAIREGLTDLKPPDPESGA